MKFSLHLTVFIPKYYIYHVYNEQILKIKSHFEKYCLRVNMADEIFEFWYTIWNDFFPSSGHHAHFQTCLYGSVSPRGLGRPYRHSGKERLHNIKHLMTQRNKPIIQNTPNRHTIVCTWGWDMHWVLMVVRYGMAFFFSSARSCSTFAIVMLFAMSSFVWPCNNIGLD